MTNLNRYSNLLLCILIVIILNGCTSAGFATRRAKNLTWSTPSLNQTECPKLDGVYENLTLLNSKLSNSLISNYQRMREDGAFSSELIALTPHAVRYRTREGKAGQEGRYFANKEEQLAYEKADAIWVRDQALLEIKTTDSYLVEAVHLDKSGNRYWQHIYRLHKNTWEFSSGCYQNLLIIRKIEFVGNEWQRAAITRAIETHFTKLPNGDLRVSTNLRRLYLDNDVPTVEDSMEVFKLYKPAAP